MKNKIFEGKVVDYTHDGKGVVKYDNYPIFVKDTIIDEEVNVKIVKWKKKYGFGRCLDVIKSSSGRIQPECPYFKRCGGCQLQFMAYPLQKEFKIRKLKNAYSKQGINLENIEFIENQHPFYYRNKLSIPLTMVNNEISAGLYKENSNDIIPIKQCLIQDDNINELLNKVVNLLNKYQINIYDKNTNKGYLRQLVMRSSMNTKQVLVGFIVNEQKYSNKLIEVIKELEKEELIKSIVINFNTRKDNVILGDTNLIVYGDGFIQDEINGLKFNISLNSFYQVNTNQMNKLYLKAIEMAQLNKDDIVLDAYCGVGSISSYLSKYVAQVVGVDIVESAISNALENKVLNNLANIAFYCDDVNLFLSKNHNKFNVVFLDPPRKGCSEEFLNKLIEMNPHKIVYIACDPATQARDIKKLQEHNYKFENICAVDMFSQTYHTESIVVLSKS